MAPITKLAGAAAIALFAATGAFAGGVGSTAVESEPFVDNDPPPAGGLSRAAVPLLLLLVVGAAASGGSSNGTNPN